MCALVAAAAPVLAHGGKTHVMGTIKAMDAAHLTVQTREGKSVSVRLSGETKYWNGDAPAKNSDLKVGGRVVVDVSGSAENQEAIEVRFSSIAEKHEKADHPAGHDHQNHGE